MDWDQIRGEYINGGVSYRDLAAKYGVSLRTIAERAKEERWVELRQSVRDKVVTETAQAIAAQSVEANVRIYRLAGLLIDKVEQAIGQLDGRVVTVKDIRTTDGVRRQRQYNKLEPGQEDTPVNVAGVQQLANVLRDLKAVLDVRSDLDRREQEYRIALLRKQAEQVDGGTDGGKLEITGLPEEFTV